MNRGCAAWTLLFVVGLSACGDQPKGAVHVLDGGEIYRLHCQVCHGADGAGVAGHCPPFQGSPRFAGEERKEVLEIVLLGRKGEVDRGGRAYRGLMPAWRNELGDGQIADVLNYIQSMPGVSGGRPFEAADVGAVRKATAREPHFPE